MTFLGAMQPPEAPRRPAQSPFWLERLCRVLVVGFGLWAGLFTMLVFFVQAATHDAILRAVIGMALGVVILWIVGAGSLSLLLRRPLLNWLQRHPIRHWRLAFVLSATSLALLEEAVTTGMTNLAPFWGVSSAQAHITASTNFFDVALLHSVIVFVPMFVVWSWLLARYSFSPLMVFVLFGLTGLLAEAISLGVYSLQIGFWVYVYGLMVYLPAYVAPPTCLARRPGWGAGLLAVVLPFVGAIPVALGVQIVHHFWFPTLP